MAARKILVILLIIIMAFFVLNMPVSTRQGINYHVHAVNIPVYLKLLDFFDRHYNYGPLVKRITKGAKSEEEKAMILFAWTQQNIRRVPAGFPVVDDHVWNIIVRGYGASDQSSDVFTTLCNYAGIEAFFTLAVPLGGGGRIPLSFVKLKGSWVVFDPYYGIYFKDKNGNFANIESLKSGNWIIERIGSATGEVGISYANYLPNLPTPKNIGLLRANIQSPLNRLLFEFGKIRSFPSSKAHK